MRGCLQSSYLALSGLCYFWNNSICLSSTKVSVVGFREGLVSLLSDAEMRKGYSQAVSTYLSLQHHEGFSRSMVCDGASWVDPPRLWVISGKKGSKECWEAQRITWAGKSALLRNKLPPVSGRGHCTAG